MRMLAEEAALAFASRPTIATSAFRSVLLRLISAQSSSDGRQLGSVTGNRWTASSPSNRSRTCHAATPSVASLQVKVGATISGGNSDSSSGYWISTRPSGWAGNSTGAGFPPQAPRASAAASSRPVAAAVGFLEAAAGIRPRWRGFMASRTLSIVE